MVYLQCESCNESMKRANAKYHGCRPRRLTCVDCGTTFADDGYSAHVTCVSEAEKYEGALFKGRRTLEGGAGAAGGRGAAAPAGRPVKRDPQSAWTAAVAAAAAAPGARHAELLGRLAGFANVPRKLKPFLAFASNSLKLRRAGELTEAFNAIAAAAAAARADKPPPPPPAAGRKRARDEGAGAGADAGGAGAPDADAEGEGEGEGAAAEADAGGPGTGAAAEAAAGAAAAAAAPAAAGVTTRAILAALRAAPGGRLKAKRLRKQCVAGGSGGEDERGDKFDARLAKLLAAGRVVQDAAGKFVQVVVASNVGEGDEE